MPTKPQAVNFVCLDKVCQEWEDFSKKFSEIMAPFKTANSVLCKGLPLSDFPNFPCFFLYL